MQAIWNSVGRPRFSGAWSLAREAVPAAAKAEADSAAALARRKVRREQADGKCDGTSDMAILHNPSNDSAPRDPNLRCPNYGLRKQAAAIQGRFFRKSFRPLS